jgi:hypothetical protein
MKTLTECVIETGDLQKGFRLFNSHRKQWNPPPANITEKTNMDRMPKEVATEMLCRMGNMDSSKNRRAYMHARCRIFESSRTRKSVDTKLDNRLKRSKWAQLVKWQRRTILHRAEVQMAHQLATRELAKANAVESKDPNVVALLGARIAVLQRSLALLDVKAAQLHVFWDAVDTEMGRRGLLIENLRTLKLHKLAAKLETATHNN